MYLKFSTVIKKINSFREKWGDEADHKMDLQ